MQELKNIVFDFGGVLIDWDPRYLYRKVFETEEEMNFFLENICKYEWNLLQDAGRSLAEATRELQEQHPEYKEEIEMYYGRWEEMLGGLFEDNVKLIKPLKEKYKVYGLTNWSAETLPIAQRKYDFFELFDGIVVSGEEKLVKPDPRFYRVLLNRYNLKAKETLLIDDNAENIRAAEKLGFQTVHVTPELNLEETLRKMKVL